jgi:hypothetical protein
MKKNQALFWFLKFFSNFVSSWLDEDMANGFQKKQKRSQAQSWQGVCSRIHPVG